MRFYSVFFIIAALIIVMSPAYAQHKLQDDDGLGHYTIIAGGTGGGIFTLPNSGGGQIMTQSNGTSPVWLLGGNNSPTSPLIGTITANDFSVITKNVTRATFSNTPSSTIPMLSFQNTTAGIQGVHIFGNADATTSSTLIGNPGVWDLVVEGDEVVTGILKAGSGSLWIDGSSATHAIKTNKPLNIMTSTNDSIMFGTNGTTKMTIGTNGYVGMGTMNPQSQLHVQGAPPDPTHKDAIPYFYLPDPYNHVLTVENTMANGKGNGIAIIIKNPKGGDPYTDGTKNNESSNYITFYNDAGDRNHIRGRVESFSAQNFDDMGVAIGKILSNADIYNPFNYFTCNLGFDIHFMDNAFNSNFIDFTYPTFPSLTGGSWPSLTYYDLKFDLPSVDIPGTPEVDVAGVEIFPAIPGYTLGGGSFDFGSFPDGLSGGSWPTFTGGSIGNLSFSNPINFGNITSPITGITNPFSLNTSFINGILDQIAAVPYKLKILDVFSSGPQIAIVKAAATYAAAFFAGGVTYESGSGDYAEWLERADHNENVGIGDVVGVIAGKISKNTDGANQLMITSWKPCALGNMPEEGKEQFFNKVAFMGQVPVKIYGSVKKGDYIIPSGHNDGFAKAVSADDITVGDLDKVLGVSWQDAPEPGVKMVKIAVGLKPHEMVKVMQDQAQEIQKLKPEINEIDTLLSEAAQIKSEIYSARSASLTKKAKHKQLSAE